MSKPIFATVAQALAALSRDRLASVWFKAGSVFVATAHGTGTFSAEEWDKAGGPKNSMAEDGAGVRVKVEVVIPGEPIGQGRPRFARRGKFVTTYDPPKSRDWKAGARECMMRALDHPARLPFPAGVGLTVTVHAVFSRPAGSYSKRTPKGRERKITRPDTENVVKAVLDAGTGTLWHDDSQVWRLIALKEIGAQDEAPFLKLTVISA